MMDNEDAETLNLGEDFKDKNCLTISEVAFILSKKKEEMEKEKSDVINDVFEKSLHYAKRFSGGISSETKEAIRKYLARVTLMNQSGEKKKLHPFQIAQLANLLPGDAEEAQTLIPSLQEYSSSDIENILKELESLKGI
ncbi:hypothetical protein ABK040_005458 [Willaertia magna]